ncbi:hypothetical protein MPH_11804 [Macrophomina phaseolina MS6]|uniref:Uncharacterized protein n=1 Tax=Macrophomina phaseolina (strain MS6) TaxID=1126212 RepID=K2QMJ2_MACPH|nr:hypothetical protein MPH_11804 [Macrophomina phaseolina MS6]
MKFSISHLAVFSAVLLSNISQAVPIRRSSDAMRQSKQEIEERAPYAPKTKLFITNARIDDVATNTDASSTSDDDDEISVFEIRDASSTQNEIKRILLPKGLLNKTTQETVLSSGSTTSEDEAAQGSVVECRVDKDGRNYCRTSDGWYVYRCETGEISYFRQMPYGDEEICSDGSIA